MTPLGGIWHVTTLGASNRYSLFQFRHHASSTYLSVEEIFEASNRKIFDFEQQYFYPVKPSTVQVYLLLPSDLRTGWGVINLVQFCVGVERNLSIFRCSCIYWSITISIYAMYVWYTVCTCTGRSPFSVSLLVGVQLCFTIVVSISMPCLGYGIAHPWG